MEDAEHVRRSSSLSDSGSSTDTSLPANHTPPQHIREVYSYAVASIAKFPCSAERLKEKLTKRFSAELVTETVDTLIQTGLLQDTSLCLNLCRYFLESKPHSKAQLYKKLLYRKFTYKCIAFCLDTLEHNFMQEEFTLPYHIEAVPIISLHETVGNDLWLCITTIALYQSAIQNPSTVLTTLKKRLVSKGYDEIHINRGISILMDMGVVFINETKV